MSLTFNGIFTDEEINEIRGMIYESGIAKSKDYLITSTRRVEKEIEKLTLSTKKVVYVLPSESNAFNTSTERIELSPKDLRILFERFFEERYNYIPDFTVRIDAFIWLPVELGFFEDEDDYEEELKGKEEDFKLFWGKFEADLKRMKDKHDGTYFEYGDKVLQMIYGHYIVSYDLKNASSGDDVVFTEEEDNGSVIISVDRERKVIYLPTYEVDEVYTRAHVRDVLANILGKKDNDELKKYIQNGFNPYTPIYQGMFPLHYAVKMKRYDKVKVLIEEAVDLDRRDENGCSAMAYAIMNDDLALIDFLKSYHADWLHVSKDETCFSLAKSEETEKYLMKFL